MSIFTIYTERRAGLLVIIKDITDLKDQIKTICHEKNITFKELAEKAKLDENGLHDKFRRKSLTVKDLNTLLACLGKTLVIKDKDK